MKVWQLIEKLRELSQDARINIYGGYSCEYGDCWNDMDIEVVQESVGWDDYNEEPIFEVFIK